MPCTTWLDQLNTAEPCVRTDLNCFAHPAGSFCERCDRFANLLKQARQQYEEVERAEPPKRTSRRRSSTSAEQTGTGTKGELGSPVVE